MTDRAMTDRAERRPAAGFRQHRRWWAALGVFLVVAVPACLLAGLPPLLPVVLVALGYAAVRPLPGLIYVLIVLMAPLGLWMIRVDDFMAWVFGGREYALSLSSSVVAVALMIGTLIRRPPTRRQLSIAVPAAAAFGAWVLVGIAHHGLAQTAAGIRITTLPVILLIVAAGLSGRDLGRMLTATAWLMIANGVAVVVEYVIGPARLITLGFQEGRAIRLIDDTFRAPGLTEVNAELGLLAGAFLLGYAALWLVRELRPRHIVWSVGAGAAVVCLALSTSRSGALLLAGGLVGAIVLNRGGGAAARKRARLIGGGMIVLVIGGFAAVGATGSSSLFERFVIWGHLIGSDFPWYGSGVGGVGAATYSRAASSPPVFVDNYLVSVVLQFGYLGSVVLVGLTVWQLIRLSRGSAEHPHYAVHLAALAGVAAGCLMIELWEYSGAMMCLALFVAYAMRTPAPTGEPDPSVPAAPTDPALDETVRLSLGSVADTVILHRADIDAPKIPRQPDSGVDSAAHRGTERHR